MLYKLGLRISSAKHKSPVYLANSLLAKRLADYIQKNNYDIVVTPHIYPADTLTAAKHKGLLTIPTVGVCTDYTLIPFWEESELDAYVIPDKELLCECEKRGIPKEKLYPYGIPVKQDFLSQVRKDEARASCHLPSDAPVFLVMSGSMGFGKLAVFSAKLAKRCTNGEHLVIICGNNDKMRSILTKEVRSNEKVHILGYTQNVSLYMDACDVIYTKPGGLTSTEALVKNIPIVFTAPIPGCESRNLHFFISRGLSVSSKTMEGQIALGKMLLEDKEKRLRMMKAQQAYRKPDCANRIIDLCENLVVKQFG